MWKLETIVTPKRGAHRIYVYENIDSLPKRWHDYEERITETQEGFSKLIPWLKEGDTFRNELFETEAWNFLTEASDELLARYYNFTTIMVAKFKSNKTEITCPAEAKYSTNTIVLRYEYAR